MKRIDELVISKTPWRICDSGDGEFDIRCGSVSYGEDYEGDDVIAQCVSNKDALLMKSAPDLYKHFREAVIEMCYAYCERGDGKCDKPSGECFVQKWIETLEEASGESEGNVK